MTSARRVVGDMAEQLALEHLQNNKLKLIERNFLCRRGEIDLLLAERSLLGSIKQIVAVEVRYRKSNAYGSAAESVGAGKQRRLIAAAQQYMSEHPQTADIAWRFDVVAVSGDLSSSPLIEWIPNAFQVC
jgi:putative endonuclease